MMGDVLSQIKINQGAIDNWIEVVMLAFELSGLQGSPYPIVSKEESEVGEDGKLRLFLELGGVIQIESFMEHFNWVWIQ